MISQDEMDYIKQFILKSGERLDIIMPTADSYFLDVKIIKHTERTYREVGLLTIAINDDKEETETVAEELLKVKLTPKKKLQLYDNDSNTINWFEHGWIIKEIWFDKDGKTPVSQHYRMGYRLYKYLQDQFLEKAANVEQEFSDWKVASQRLPSNRPLLISEHRERGVNHLLSIISEFYIQNSSQLKELPYFPVRWSIEKRLKFLHFILAFLQLCLVKKEFDWKEIGASYYKEIGGSKEFDPYKDDFIDQLEVLAQCPAALLGMTSLGKITPLYFSGQVTGSFSTYHYGPVHALTDLSISEETYSTSAKILWLVENRAILTRMTTEKNFLRDTQSIILCVDGHVRSSHQQAISQLLLNSQIQQVIIWSDYDPDGLQIAKELNGIVSKKYQGQIKWITAEHRVMVNWNEYEVYMHAFLKHKKMEQELVLGEVQEWKKWINH